MRNKLTVHNKISTSTIQLFSDTEKCIQYSTWPSRITPARKTAVKHTHTHTHDSRYARHLSNKFHVHKTQNAIAMISAVNSPRLTPTLLTPGGMVIHTLLFILSFANRGCAVKTEGRSERVELVLGSLQTPSLTLTLLTWRIGWSNNASKWQMGFHLAFKGLNSMPAYTGQNCADRLFSGLRKYVWSVHALSSKFYIFIH
jgi:hypothetical protein